RLGRRSQPKPYSRFADPPRLPPTRQPSSRPPPPTRSVDPDQVGSSPVSVYAAKSMPSHNYPARGPAASSVRWHRSSGWSHTTSHETTRSEEHTSELQSLAYLVC